jgi:hypothetical protein
MKTFLIGVLVAGVVALGAVCVRQHRTINALIELNHSKSVYIDSGCTAPYRGAEELLPGEPTQ